MAAYVVPKMRQEIHLFNQLVDESIPLVLEMSDINIELAEFF